MGIRRFGVCRDGNVAMTFAFCLIPLLVGIGAAVDYARLADAREIMQNSLDATVLALSSEAPKLTADELNTRATDVFGVNFSSGKADNVTVSATFTKANGAMIAATASGTVPMTFMGLVGIPSQTLTVQSKSAWSSKRLRVALALDNTGSMADNGKMDALKTATKNLLTKLQGSSTTTGDVFVSIVPFSKDVNIGTSNKALVNWTKRGRKCSWVRGWNSWQLQCPAQAQDLWTAGKAQSDWTGCVSDRDKDYNNYDISVTPASDQATLYPANDDVSCPEQLTPMTDNWTTLTSAVDAMAPLGPTNQTIGLVWAWQSLKSTSPLYAPAKDVKYDYQDVIILLSDGENTMNRFSGDGGNHSVDVDDRMSRVCTAAKADSIIIYTVLVISGTESVLKGCASSADNYFNASSADQIITSFGAIGDKLSALRIAH